MTDAPAPAGTPAPASSAPAPGSALLNAQPGSNGSATPANGGPAKDGQGHNSGGAFDANGDWRSFFKDGLDESVSKDWDNWSSRYDSPQNFAKGYVELRKSSIVIPKDDSKPEAWDEVFTRMGRPKDAKEYKFNWDQGIPALAPAEVEAQEAFRAQAHKMGLSQRQMDGLVKWNGEQRKVSADGWDVAAQTTTDRNVKTLKSAWGPDFDRNVNAYNTTLKSYAGQNYDQFKTMRLDDGSFLADNPAFVQMMTKVGLERSEDDRNPSPFNASARESAQAQIAKLESEAMKAGLNPTSPNWPNDQLVPLYKKAYGSKPMGPGELHQA